MCLYGEKKTSLRTRQVSGRVDPSSVDFIGSSSSGFAGPSSVDFDSERECEAEEPESLFEHVARLNGPLEEYHPQMMLQCLLWGQFLLSYMLSNRQVLETDARLIPDNDRKNGARERDHCEFGEERAESEEGGWEVCVDGCAGGSFFEEGADACCGEHF